MFYKRSSAINSIYSGQQLFSYSMKLELYLNLFHEQHLLLVVVLKKDPADWQTGVSLLAPLSHSSSDGLCLHVPTHVPQCTQSA
jgi:hypothetical protein